MFTPLHVRTNLSNLVLPVHTHSAFCAFTLLHSTAIVALSSMYVYSYVYGEFYFDQADEAQEQFVTERQQSMSMDETTEERNNGPIM